ncbi:hypothetical protein DSO57_1032659 [Entomophthora muscae]|uniref:Uncharacterized protein n=1 Tax=Entomophthora muscae TaxID=34485 RepID=A0ACC2S2E4_9FUNG|nr:hypothetical protein DSO57_1032659 [Entomophthora muscae]
MGAMHLFTLLTVVLGVSAARNNQRKCSSNLHYTRTPEQRLASYILVVRPGYSSSIKTAAERQIIRAGGYITNRYNSIDGFAAVMPVRLFDLLQSSCYYGPGLDIEDNAIVTIN